MNGVALSRDRIVAPTSPSSRSIVTTPQIVLTFPVGVRPSTADPRSRPATRPGMLGHPPEGPPPKPRRFHDMSYSRASDPYEVYRDSSTTLSSIIGRRTHSHPAAPMRELRTGPPPKSLARGHHVQQQQQQQQQRVDLPRGMLNLDQILQPRKPALPPNARALLKKRTTSHATQTVSTIATQTDAGSTQPPSTRGGGGAPQAWQEHRGAQGGKENAFERDAGATGAEKYVDVYAAVGPAASQQWSHGGGLGASAPGSTAGSRRVSLAPSSSSEQLEQLDSLLHEHQRRLRERVEGVRVEQARKQKEWFASVKQSLPSPQRLAGDAIAGGHAPQPARSGAQPLSRPGTAPPTPSRLGLTPAASPQRRPTAVNAETSPSSNRSSLESLAELEALLEAQHQQLIQRGYIAPAEEW